MDVIPVFDLDLTCDVPFALLNDAENWIKCSLKALFLCRLEI